MTRAPVYRVTFDRIGRDHCVEPLDARAETAGDLAQAIFTYARPYLASRDVAVDLDPAEFAAAENGGQGDGLIICGLVHVGGTFTIAPPPGGGCRHNPQGRASTKEPMSDDRHNPRDQ